MEAQSAAATAAAAASSQPLQVQLNVGRVASSFKIRKTLQYIIITVHYRNQLQLLLAQMYLCIFLILAVYYRRLGRENRRKCH
jgi:hypothetical protein